MTQFLAADLGTTSIKLAVISSKGKFIAIRSQRLERFHPNFGWSEQDPKDWWEGFCACSQKVMEDINVDISKLSGIAVCGQMHAPVPLNRNGHLLSNRVQLWDDKRCSSQVINYFAKINNSESLDEYSNFPASCWSAFKIAWIMDNQPEIYENTSSFLTPKDYINYCLTNRICTDLTEASGSFLLDFQTLKYSKKRAESLEIDLAKFPEIINSDQVIGTISSVASANTGIPTGLPVMSGGGDSMVALLGSSILEPGQSAEITGTSTVIANQSNNTLYDPKISHLLSTSGKKISLMCIDSGGDSVRWIKSLLENENLNFEDLDQLLTQVPVGSCGLYFIPCLIGERNLNSFHTRAQFFGMSSNHTKEYFYRAVTEGLAMMVTRNLKSLQQSGEKVEKLIVSGAGAQGSNWLKMKASIYGMPLYLPECLETGLIGGAILVGKGTGLFGDLKEGCQQLVNIKERIDPDPKLTERYLKHQQFFECLYNMNQLMSEKLM